MQFVSDLHSHSRYSRAVSRQMVLSEIAAWARLKGIDVVATGDWTHPLWIKELEAGLEEAAEGLYALRVTGAIAPSPHQPLPFFLLSTEVSAIYSQGGKTRRIHLLLFAPSFASVAKINKELTSRRANLFSDGRPILGMSAHNIVELVLTAYPRCLVIPAHAWTPWFSLYGSMSGFDSIDECFGELSKFVYGIETGLSSDPAMNWRIDDLDHRSILSFSDAHSPAKLGREATVFELPELSYENIYKAIRHRGSWALGLEIPNSLLAQEPNSPRIAYTIEFYPEEGKYHFTGHRNCSVRHSPGESKKLGTVCPKCKRELTVGVMHRVEQLSKKEQERLIEADDCQLRWVKDPQGKRPPYVMMVPLLEILAEALNSPFSGKRTIFEYNKLTDKFENELAVLLRTKGEDIARLSGPKVAEAIAKVRSGDIVVDPGYDGVFGKVKIWNKDQQQTGLF